MVKVNGTELDIAGKTVSEYQPTTIPSELRLNAMAISYSSLNMMSLLLMMATAWRLSVL